MSKVSFCHVRKRQDIFDLAQPMYSTCSCCYFVGDIKAPLLHKLHNPVPCRMHHIDLSISAETVKVLACFDQNITMVHYQYTYGGWVHN